jgi:hypothetical protein
MKVAILGNMNNNGFALMRYFRDLGVDAHLLLYSNDGIGSLEHFKPENDTFEIEKWRAFIHQTSFFNGTYHVLPESFQKIFTLIYNIRNKFLERELRLSPLSIMEVTNMIQSFTNIVTSGYGPAILHRASRNASIFSPYASGIEGINRMYAPSLLSLLNRVLFEYGRYVQIKALKHVNHIVTAEIGITKVALKENSLYFKALAMPMVYVEQNYPEYTGLKNIDEIGAELEACDFSVIMHSRLAWNSAICKKNNVRSKNNHWVILSFNEIIKKKPSIKSRLLILEYGPDVINTKKLVSDLGLDYYVTWIPKTSRRNLMWLLSRVSLGVGEFIESPRTIWGGTGWEVLASGKPLLQGFFFEDGEYEASFGHPEPPLLKVRSQEDVTNHMLEIANNPQKAVEIGSKSKEWFHNYNGLNLATQWLYLLAEGSKHRDQSL